MGDTSMGDVYRSLSRVLSESRIRFSYERGSWRYDSDEPNLRKFDYDVSVDEPSNENDWSDDEQKGRSIGTVSGYIYRDADGDGFDDFLDQCDHYGESMKLAEALKAELDCYAKCFDFCFCLADYESILLITDVSIDATPRSLFVETVASLIVAHSPELVILDPWDGEAHRVGVDWKAEDAVGIGFWPMVSAPYLMGRNHKNEDMIHRFSDLLKAMEAGKFKRILKGNRDPADMELVRKLARGLE